MKKVYHRKLVLVPRDQRKQVPKEYRLPPDIFWMRPDGKVMPVIGHGTDMMARPERYGLHVAPIDAPELNAAMERLFEEGWTRGRWSMTDRTADFQILRPEAGVPLGNAHAFALKHQAHIDKVRIDFWEASRKKAGRDFEIAEFMEIKFPASWGYSNPPRRSR